MNAYADKTNSSKRRAITHEPQQKGKHTGKLKFADHGPESVAQRVLQTAANAHTTKQNSLPSQKENKTGLPDTLKTGVENLSGYSLNDVRVHYNSSKPAQLQAHAYAQGTDIHVASGQEKHLPHEAWHVVQQKQGRVHPTMQLKGHQSINTEVHLEKEAETMGSIAARLQMSSIQNPLSSNFSSLPNSFRSQTIQRYDIHANDPDYGTRISTTNNLYHLENIGNNETVYGRNHAPVPRYSKEISEFNVNNVITKEYEPSQKFVADCLHTAEEIMHNHPLEEGAVRSKVTTTDAPFGDTARKNWQAADAVNPAHRNHQASPAVGSAYAIVAQRPIDLGAGVRCQYHAAAVVAIDGTDHITLEVFGRPNQGAHEVDGRYSIYNSAPGSGLTFHSGWINTFKNGITISISPQL